jgi:hypothetical protein
MEGSRNTLHISVEGRPAAVDATMSALLKVIMPKDERPKWMKGKRTVVGTWCDGYSTVELDVD